VYILGQEKYEEEIHNEVYLFRPTIANWLLRSLYDRDAASLHESELKTWC